MLKLPGQAKIFQMNTHQKIQVYIFLNFLRFSMEFQSSLQKLQRSPCWHYSSESQSIHITPWPFSNSNNQVPGRVRAGGGGLTGQNRRRRVWGWGKWRAGQGGPPGVLGASEEGRRRAVGGGRRSGGGLQRRGRRSGGQQRRKSGR